MAISTITKQRPKVLTILHWALVILLALVYRPAIAAPGGDLQFKRLLTEQGISIGSVEVVFQDSHGYMWFGGDADNGLVQYDGYNFTIHRHDPNDPRSISSSIVWDMYEDRHGELWIATDIGLNRFDRDTGQFTRFLPNSHDPAAEVFTRAIVEDIHGQMWVASFGGLLRFDREQGTFHAYFNDPADDQSVSANQIRTLLPDRNGGLWVGTDREGLNFFDTHSGKFRRYPFGSESSGSESSGSTSGDGTHGASIRSLLQTADGTLWVGTENGLSVMDSPATAGQFRHFLHDKNNPNSLSQNIVDALAEDYRGNLWIGTEGGLNYLNRETGQFTVYRHNPNRSRSLANNVVRSLHLDASNNLWIGNFPAGVNFLASTNIAFSTFRHDPDNSNSLNQSSVLSLHEDAAGNLWLGTDGGGLNYFDRAAGRFTHYPPRPGESGSLSAGAILSIEKAHDHRLWAGTWGGGANLFDPHTGQAIQYSQREGSPSEHVWALTMDSQGDLWAGSIGGGAQRYEQEQNRFIWFVPDEHDPNSLQSYVVWSIFEDHTGRVWLGTGEGLAYYRPETNDFATYAHDSSDSGSISSDVVTHIAEDNQHRLWVATRGGGLNLFDRASETFSHIDEEDGLASNVVVSVVPDDYGNIWLGTTSGLSRYTPETGRIVNYSEENGLQGNQFNIGAALKLSTGELAFGGIYGFTLFDPQDLQPSEHVPPVDIVAFEIFNKPVPVATEGSPLTKAITQTSSITLNYKQSVFSLSYVALSYSSPEKNKYAYMLEGFEDQWNYVGDRRTATYTNLDPGSYVFRVKAANSQGIWNEEGSAVSLHILPPPWRTWWAYSIYILLIAGIIIAFVRAQQKKVEVEREINRRLQQLDKLKDEFLANTSHELRTPLNGIIGIAESLTDGVGGEQSEISHKNLAMIISSGRRLERLVNDILDFSQLKEHSLILRQKPLDMRALVQVVLALSEPLVDGKKIALVNAVDPDVPQVYADEDRVQQILHNLVGNAIKFTHEGTVSVSARLLDDKRLEICVRDSGIGMSAEALPHIFDAFQQIQGATDRSFGGTGLGLAVTKQLIELHGGTINVESTPDQGSLFSFTLPLANDDVMGSRTSRRDLFGASDNISYTTSTIAADAEHLQSVTMLPSEPDPARERWHILVVDDEPVNRQVLVNHLHLQHYRVTAAASGQEALDLVAEQHFDLLLLDIMMPQLSGYEVCKQLRQRFSSHELPVIFLTAKNQINDLITGFNLGANDFLTKPINRDELLARVNTHLELLEINRDLEKKVVERTKALQQKHQQLEAAYKQLEEISLSDPLTGLSNRRYLQKLIPMDVAKVQREYRHKIDKRPPPQEVGNDLVFLLLDVDHFKPVNDVHGHSAGDQLLIQISNLLTQISREADWLVRWGGEEFLIVSRFSHRNDAQQMAERIRRTVANHAFTLADGEILSKTCSIGYACYPFITDQPDALSWEQVIDTADLALYAAKKSGRNRCVGLTATATTPSKQLYRHISQDLKGMIDRGEIGVAGDNTDNLVWD